MTDGSRRFDRETLAAYFRQHPVAYSGFAVIYNRRLGREIGEVGEVPYLKSPAFALLLVGYLLYARGVGLASRLVPGGGRVTPVPQGGHVFTMSERAEYRSRPLTAVAAELDRRGIPVTLLCSPDAEERAPEWRADGFNVVTHRDLHRGVRLTRLPGFLLGAFRHTYRLLVEVERVPWRTYVVVINAMFLEQVKAESVAPIFENGPWVHTQAPMPYLLRSTHPSRVFVYQHGLQRPASDILVSCPFFVPLTYFTWGDIWTEVIEERVHPDSEVLSTGSPWHDALAERERKYDREPAWDVVFVSGTHRVSGEHERRYESLFETLVAECDDHGWSLAVKLHPLEERDWYDRRGWGRFVESFPDIDEALLDAKIAVTDTSSAFVESQVLGTPVVLANLMQGDLGELAPLEGVYFPETNEEVASVLRRVLNPDGDEQGGDGGTEEVEAAQLVRLGRATERIVAYVLGAADG